MRKPDWVNQLKNARDADRIRDGMVWHVIDCDGVDLGQFADGKWFCGPCAGDSASEAVARHYLAKSKAMLDDIDDALRISPHRVFIFCATDEQMTLLDWYATARRAELKEGK